MNRPSFPHKQLKQWFAEVKRDLPWRHAPSPYAVWVSEVMLQQTQVTVVLPYFLRWVEAFPNVEALARAPIDQVIKCWEGLGYYSRARNLHQGAQYVMEHFGGELPSSRAELMQIKGLGPYTVGAILSFAFHQRAAAVDGNVLRVLARYYAIEEDISKPKTVKKIWELAQALLPEQEPWIVSEALIELGATVCMRKPSCSACPIKGHCQALQQGRVDQLPIKTVSLKSEKLYRAVAVIRSGNHFLINRGAQGLVMADLHEFPYFETDKEGIAAAALAQKVEEKWSLKVSPEQPLTEVKHSFTRFSVLLSPVILNAKKQIPVPDYRWVGLDELEELAFSSGHRRILHQLLQRK
jgi:A/G-specific adenine glycosylase